VSGWSRIAARLATLAAVLTTVGCFVVPPSSSAAEFTWSGGSPSAAWSVAGNWQAGSAPGGPVDALHFPALGGTACDATPPSGSCYQSRNDLSGVAAGAISIDDGAAYEIGGNGLTLGSGGLVAAPLASGSSTGAGPTLALPIGLDGAQAWSISGGPTGQGLTVAGAVSGPVGDPLGIQLNGSTTLTIGDAEVGPVTVTGDGTIGDGFLVLGAVDPSTGANVGGTLNASDAAPLRVAAGAGVLGLDGRVGPVSTAAGAIEVGQADRPGTLAVAGDVALDSRSTFVAFVSQPGAAPGADFSQLTATGGVDLADASLALEDGEIAGETACAQLAPGDRDVLITAAGGVSGTFAGVPDGAVVGLACPGSGGTPPTATINYTADAVTATIVTPGTPGTPTTTTVAATSSTPVVNQVVTLTAFVASAADPPAGTVAFLDGRATIAGCGAEPLAGVGGYYVATCHAAFPHAGAVSLSVVFTPASGSTLASSASAVDGIEVGQGSTSVNLAGSTSTVAGDGPATYTATVTLGQSGPAEPSGTVDFLDDGRPVTGCTALPLDGGAPSPTVTCRQAFPASAIASLQAITARYSGDGNFAASVSPARTLTVAPSPLTAPKTAGQSRRARIGRASVSATLVGAVVTCPVPKAQSCAVTLRLTARETVAGGKAIGAARGASKTVQRTVAVGSRTVKLRAGVGETVHVALNTAGRRALANAHRLAVTLAATQTAGRTVYHLSTQHVTLKRATLNERRKV
jgi:hypothetical protein